MPETPTASSARVYVESARASGPGGSMDGTNVSLQCSLSAPQDVLTDQLQEEWYFGWRGSVQVRMGGTSGH